MTSPPRVDDNVNVVSGESLFGILRDFLRVGVEDVVPALHHVNRDFVFQNLGVLEKNRSAFRICRSMEVRTYFNTSSAIMSASSAANSTPVGPPPQTTKDNNRLRSSEEVVGRDASSRLARKILMSIRHCGAEQVERRLTHDSPSDSLSVWHRFQLEAMFKPFDTVIVGRGTAGNDQFVIYTQSQQSISAGVMDQLTWQVSPGCAFALVARYFDLQ